MKMAEIKTFVCRFQTHSQCHFSVVINRQRSAGVRPATV